MLRFRADPPLQDNLEDPSHTERQFAELWEKLEAGLEGLEAYYEVEQYKILEIEALKAPGSGDYIMGTGTAMVTEEVGSMAVTGYSETGVPLVSYQGRQYSHLALSVALEVLAHVNSTIRSGLALGSGYRSDSQQAGLASIGDGQAAPAGTSHHRTGHAFDLGVGGGSYSDSRLQEGHDYSERLGANALVHGNAGGGGFHTHVSCVSLAGTG